MQMAEEAGLDLVEISPNAEPPVCKIMDFGKFKYETQKREAEARKKQKIIEIKEIKFRPGTDTHDYDVKMRSVFKFLEEGDKVKVTLRFRGREMAHPELGLNILERLAGELGEAAALVQELQAAMEATGTTLAPYAGMGLEAFRGRQAETTALVEATIEDVSLRGEGNGIAVAQWATAVLNNDRQLKPYDHEWVAPIPVYLETVGLAHGRYRKLIELRYFSELSYEEIAEEEAA